MSPLLHLGLALGVAYLLGRLCARVSVPRVTGYLLAGVLTSWPGWRRISRGFSASSP